MSRRRRVAYAVADDAGLVLGQVATRGLLLTPDGLVRRELGFPDGQQSPQLLESWRTPWVQVTSLTAQAPRSDKRKPGLLPMLAATTLELVGAAGIPDTADVVVTVGLGDAEREVVCDGYVGRGYWRGDAAALEALLGLLVCDASVRTQLADPSAVLRAVAEVGEADLSEEDASRALRDRWA